MMPNSCRPSRVELQPKRIEEVLLEIETASLLHTVFEPAIPIAVGSTSPS
jgi:hypothetical protein